ncbi:MAG: hypothetical protein C0478_18360 [Planctomyces sp.]|nr:hypothetical protein [Planctomyces sp.]
MECSGKKVVGAVLTAPSDSVNLELPLWEAINVWVAEPSEKEKLQSVNDRKSAALLQVKALS